MRKVSLVVVLGFLGCREADGPKDTEDTQVGQDDTQVDPNAIDADGDGPPRPVARGTLGTWSRRGRGR